jgi:acyl dehydratase
LSQDISYQTLELGKAILLGKLSLSESEIIEYAKAFDPLEFHINKEAAKKSIFGELVASGPHIFQVMHRKFWLERFGNTVLAGLEVDKWKFLKPVFPNREVECYVTILSKKINSDSKTATIKWFYEFKYSGSGELVQCLEMTVLHSLTLPSPKERV